MLRVIDYNKMLYNVVHTQVIQKRIPTGHTQHETSLDLNKGDDLQ